MTIINLHLELIKRHVNRIAIIIYRCLGG